MSRDGACLLNGCLDHGDGGQSRKARLIAQIAFVLKQAEDGTAIGEVCRNVGISEATFYAGASAELDG